MRVEELRIDGFRGFDSAVVRPRGHVALVGEPRSGRSDIISALERVLHPDATRWAAREWDFHGRDLGREIRVQATLTNLGTSLRQRFLRRIEAWDRATSQIVTSAANPLEEDGVEAALRLQWICVWDRDEERADQRLEYVKRLGGTGSNADRVSREDRAALPFRSVRLREPLAIRSEGDFRTMLESAASEDVLDAIRGLADGIDALSADLSEVPAIVSGLDRVLAALREPLGVHGDAADVVRFLPDGGAVSGLLRSLTAALDLADGAGHLPATRHGSTLGALLSAAEAVWWAESAEGVVAIDDFGDGLDGQGATRLAGLFKDTVGQAWVSSRRSEVARVFDLEDLIRLTGTGQDRRHHQCDAPVTKVTRAAMRHFQLQLLPAMTARAVIICEGPHDVASLRSVAERAEAEHGTPPPLAHRIELVDGGGKDHMRKVASLARQMGFYTVCVLDWDRDDAEAAAVLSGLQPHCDATVRFPTGVAIERALMSGVTDDDLRSALEDVVTAFGLKVPPVDGLDRPGLESHAMSHVLKSGSGGLHSAFIDALPAGVVPVLASSAITAAVQSILGGTIGIRQL